MTFLIIIIVLVCALIALDIGASVFLINFALRRNASQNSDPEPTTRDWSEYYERAKKGKQWMLSLEPEKCEIRSFEGLKLHAHLVRSETPSKKIFLCVHGYRSSGLFEFGAIAPFFRSMGFDMLLVDDRACGESEGKYMGFGNLDRRDCIAWCDYIVSRYGHDCEIVLYGISMGGATVLSASGDSALPNEVRGVIGDCGFSSGRDEMKTQLHDMFHMPPFPILYTAALFIRIFAGFSLRENAARDMIRNTGIPLLIIHGGDDKYVPTYMAKEIYDNASCDKRLMIVPGATHAMSLLTDEPGYKAAVKEFIDRAGL